MKRGGMYQRDSRETPGCLIVMSAAFTASMMFMAGTLILKAVSIIK